VGITVILDIQETTILYGKCNEQRLFGQTFLKRPYLGQILVTIAYTKPLIIMD